MVVFVNGAFGSGKTTIAELLAQNISGSLLFDPEEVGLYVRKVLSPIDSPADFQHYALWRELTVATIAGVVRDYDAHVIVPMSVRRKEYLSELLAGIRTLGVPVHHFTLTAKKETLLGRLAARGETSDAWCWQETERYGDGFFEEPFRIHVDTESRPPDEIFREIIAGTKA